MPRSGSELLQCILHQNPNIYASVTSPLLEYQFGARSNYTLPEVKSQDPAIMQKAFISMCKSMAQGYYSEITDRPIIVDKNRGWSHYYEWTKQWNPEGKIVCMVRDLRSIFASMERVYRNNRHHPESIDNPVQIQNVTTEQRVAHWSATQPIGLAIERLISNIEQNTPILFIRYEDLCEEPSKTMDIFYRYMEIDPFYHQFNNIEKKVYEDDSHYGIFGSHKVNKVLKPSQPNSWSDVISENLSDKIKEAYPWYFEKFSY